MVSANFKTEQIRSRFRPSTKAICTTLHVSSCIEKQYVGEITVLEFIFEAVVLGRLNYQSRSCLCSPRTLQHPGSIYFKYIQGNVLQRAIVREHHRLPNLHEMWKLTTLHSS